MVRTWLLCAATLLVACNGILGLEEREGRAAGGAAGTGGAAGGGGALGCVGAACFPPGPSGWGGPLVFADGPFGTVPACEGAFATEELRVFAELADTTHSCPCSCGPATGIGCSVSVHAWDDVNCTVFSQARTFDDVGDCDTFGSDPRGANYPPPVIDLANASCAPTVEPANLPPIAWAREGRGCGPVSALEEVPNGFSACIFQEGDAPCPAGDYAVRTMWFQGATDNRVCGTDCTCGPVTDADCAPLIESHRNFSCSEEPKITPAQPGCVVGFFDSARLVSVSPTGTCSATDATATGAAAVTGPTTVCCMAN